MAAARGASVAPRAAPKGRRRRLGPAFARPHPRFKVLRGSGCSESERAPESLKWAAGWKWSRWKGRRRGPGAAAPGSSRREAVSDLVMGAAGADAIRSWPPDETIGRRGLAAADLVTREPNRPISRSRFAPLCCSWLLEIGCEAEVANQATAVGRCEDEVGPQNGRRPVGASSVVVLRPPLRGPNGRWCCFAGASKNERPQSSRPEPGAAPPIVDRETDPDNNCLRSLNSRRLPAHLDRRRLAQFR